MKSENQTNPICCKKTNKIVIVPMIGRNSVTLVFLVLLFWSVNNLNTSAARLHLEAFNRDVEVRVVELPLCGRSNTIVVEYNTKKYAISINKNDCIQGKYAVGDVIPATYNTKLDEVNPKNFVGMYRMNILFVFLVAVGFLVSLFFPVFLKWRRPKS